MAALAGIMNHYTATGQSAASMSSATPMTGSASTTSSSKSSSSSSATITANDFLTLLVTEMKNQDPTSQSDPNEYINQLVQVNSLEQLIDVNQNLVTGLGIKTDASQSTTADAVNSNVANATAQSHAAAQKGASSALPSTGLSTVSSTATTAAAAANQVSGNLSVPQATTASQRVAHSLGRHSVSQ